MAATPIYGLENSLNPAEKAPVEILPLRLMGTVVALDPVGSIAVIKDTRLEEQHVLRIAETILDYQIVKIMRGKVTLLKDGRLYILDFPMGSEFLVPITIVSDNVRIINRNALIGKISDLDSVMHQALPIPHIVSGKLAGFKITNIKDKELAKMAGIREGDIVMGIDGEKINSIKSVFGIYSRVKIKEKVNLEIKRNNEIKNLTYYIN